MSERITDIRNLGPAMENMLAEIDIPDRQTLERLGAVEAFRWLKFRFGRDVTIVALYAMAAGLQDRDWRSLSHEEKERLRKAVAASG